MSKGIGWLIGGLEHGVGQIAAVDAHDLYVHAQLLAQAFHGVVIQEHGLAVAQHVQRDQHPAAEITALELCGDILSGEETCHVNGVAEEVVFNGHHLALQAGETRLCPL